jgi:hypothetical protein
MSPVLIVVIVICVVAVVVAIGLNASRSRNDGVDSFRRQIDALSPEARRPVVDQVQSAAESHEPEDSDADAPAGSDDEDDGDDADDADDT